MRRSQQVEFLSVAQAAKLLGVSHSTVWRWVDADELPAYRIGPKTIRIRREDLDAVIRPVKPRTKEVGAAVDRMKPPSKQEIERRKALVSEILALREKLSIAPLTSSDLIHRVREEEQQSYGKPR